jgi:hypothetical protein
LLALAVSLSIKQLWSIDFMHDQLQDSEFIRLFNATAVRTGPVPLNSIPQFISGFSTLLKLPLMLVAGF